MKNVVSQKVYHLQSQDLTQCTTTLRSIEKCGLKCCINFYLLINLITGVQKV